MLTGSENSVAIPHALRRGGLTRLDRPAAHYGLPLILGAAEVDLVSLTRLYAAIADGGRVGPLRWRADRAPDPAPREPWLSADAVAWLDATLTGAGTGQKKAGQVYPKPVSAAAVSAPSIGMHSNGAAAKPGERPGD